MVFISFPDRSNMQYWDEDGVYILHPIGRKKKPPMVRVSRLGPMPRRSLSAVTVPVVVPVPVVLPVVVGIKKSIRVVLAYGEASLYYAAIIESVWKKADVTRYSIKWEQGTTLYGGEYSFDNFLLFALDDHKFKIGDIVRTEITDVVRSDKNHSFPLGTVIGVSDFINVCCIQCQDHGHRVIVRANGGIIPVQILYLSIKLFICMELLCPPMVISLYHQDMHILLQ